MAAVFIERGYDRGPGGTDDHLMLISLVKQGLTGKAADAALGAAHITVNKTPCRMTRSRRLSPRHPHRHPGRHHRGFKQTECRELAGWICDILDDMDNPAP